QKLSEILKDSLSQIFRMMSQEELKHAYRLKIMYETVHK
ncbi:MAG TPA: rubrerythrin family protein, partial [Thermococcus paralvinellae]|nr:rubrerythrin family protein [Thermococcus paralvinellae]